MWRLRRRTILFRIDTDFTIHCSLGVVEWKLMGEICDNVVSIFYCLSLKFGVWVLVLGVCV